MDQTTPLILSSAEICERLQNNLQNRPGAVAMYSSVFQGITLEVSMMQVPLEDHLVHRGDGVFETIKCLNGMLYNLDAHLQRFKNSADFISLPERFHAVEIAQTLQATLKAGGLKNALIRLIISRGTGGYGVDPYEAIQPELYIVVYQLPHPFMERHPEGASIALSDVPVKPMGLSTVKTCNYLPNTLMKKQAVDAGVDFMIAQDDSGYVTESATENIGMLTREGDIVIPPFDAILPGTTMLRVKELAEALVTAGDILSIQQRPFTAEELSEAKEAFIFGTTTDVTAVTTMSGEAIGDGKPGPVFEKLSQLFLDDLHTNPERLTPAWDD